MAHIFNETGPLGKSFAAAGATARPSSSQRERGGFASSRLARTGADDANRAALLESPVHNNTLARNA